MSSICININHSTKIKPLMSFTFCFSRFLEEFESNVIYDMPEPRLIGPNMEPPQFDHIQDRYGESNINVINEKSYKQRVKSMSS